MLINTLAVNFFQITEAIKFVNCAVLPVVFINFIVLFLDKTRFFSFFCTKIDRNRPFLHNSLVP